MAAVRSRSPLDRVAQTKPTGEAYLGLLLISLVTLIIGSGLLYLDYNHYLPFKPAPASAPPPAVAGAGGAVR